MGECGTRTGIELPGGDASSEPHRQLCIKRDRLGHLVLHDMQTGMPLDAQIAVNIEQKPFDATTVTVRFSCDPRAKGHVVLMGDVHD